MKNQLLLILFLMLANIAFSQKFSHKVNSEEGKFSLAFPVKPVIEKNETDGINTAMYLGQLEKKVFLFSYTLVQESPVGQAEILETALNAFTESTAIEVKTKREIKKGKITGLYGEGSSKSGLHVAYEVYFQNNILYQIGVMSEEKIESKAMKSFSKRLIIK
jgi:hypothetical protein